MSRPFKFKQFSIQQEFNTQKVGTDSMLLGAWVSGSYQRILDIGTGTGILALMLAQKNETAVITAIEPDLASLSEAIKNFGNSQFRSRIMGVHSPLQQFSAIEKFDLIISNPPYFENAYLSENKDKNRARHTNDLPVHELYEGVADLLSESGKFAVIIPIEEEEHHLKRAFEVGLYPNQILRTIREDGSFKRTLLSYSFVEVTHPVENKILVKDSSNQYSEEYIALTKAFYFKDLSKK